MIVLDVALRLLARGRLTAQQLDHGLWRAELEIRHRRDRGERERRRAAVGRGDLPPVTYHGERIEA